jgi:transposase
LTVVTDIDTAGVVFVGDGKGADALDPFWKRLCRSRAKIKAVAMDMSPAYIRAVSDHLPKASIVFDHFHVIKLYNDKLSDFRRKLYYELNNEKQKKVIKGTRWLLLKNPLNLNSDKNEKEKLQLVLDINKLLATA